MAGVNLKTDFKDGDKLFGQQLNNNFGAIQAALNTMNKIVWQDDPDDMVVTFRGTTEEINSRDIIDGQLLYDTTTGETYIDYGSQRISTGSGNAIFIGDTEPTNPSTQLWIKPNEPMQVIGSEVINSLEGNETNKAPSVKAVNDGFGTFDEKLDYSEEEHLIGKWIDGKPLYGKVINKNTTLQANTWHNFYYNDLGLSNIDFILVEDVLLTISEGIKESVWSSPKRLQYLNGYLSIYSDAEVTGEQFILKYTKTTDGGAE